MIDSSISSGIVGRGGFFGFDVVGLPAFVLPFGVWVPVCSVSWFSGDWVVLGRCFGVGGVIWREGG